MIESIVQLSCCKKLIGKNRLAYGVHAVYICVKQVFLMFARINDKWVVGYQWRASVYRKGPAYAGPLHYAWIITL